MLAPVKNHVVLVALHNVMYARERVCAHARNPMQLSQTSPVASSSNINAPRRLAKPDSPCPACGEDAKQRGGSSSPAAHRKDGTGKLGGWALLLSPVFRLSTDPASRALAYAPSRNASVVG